MDEQQSKPPQGEPSPSKPPMLQTAPKVEAPPTAAARSATAGSGSAFQRVLSNLGLGAIVFVKFGKILLTLGTMLLSMWIYARLWGWPFAAGFVICILIHELGHVFVAKACGHKVSAPMFIPFMGALITTQKEKSAWEAALIGIGGPLFGAFAAIGCWAIFTTTHSGLFLGLAYTGFLLNLFNMMPLYPMDGGRIVGAVHPILWLIGLAGLVVGFVTGFIRNPMIIILVVLSADRLWKGLRTQSVDVGYSVRTTPSQRWTMAVGYVALTLVLAWGMAETQMTVRAIREMRNQQATVAAVYVPANSRAVGQG